MLCYQVLITLPLTHFALIMQAGSEISVPASYITLPFNNFSGRKFYFLPNLLQLLIQMLFFLLIFLGLSIWNYNLPLPRFLVLIFLLCIWHYVKYYMGFPGGSAVKNPLANAGDVALIFGWEDPLEKEIATHSSILAWEIPRTEAPGGLQSMGSERVDTT